eukprot:761120-Hanusia_phi.AAC.2
MIIQATMIHAMIMGRGTVRLSGLAAARHRDNPFNGMNSKSGPGRRYGHRRVLSSQCHGWQWVGIRVGLLSICRVRVPESGLPEYRSAARKCPDLFLFSGDQECKDGRAAPPHCRALSLITLPYLLSPPTTNITHCLLAKDRVLRLMTPRNGGLTDQPGCQLLERSPLLFPTPAEAMLLQVSFREWTETELVTSTVTTDRREQPPSHEQW